MISMTPPTLQPAARPQMSIDILAFDKTPAAAESFISDFETVQTQASHAALPVAVAAKPTVATTDAAVSTKTAGEGLAGNSIEALNSENAVEETGADIPSAISGSASNLKPGSYQGMDFGPHMPNVKTSEVEEDIAKADMLGAAAQQAGQTPAVSISMTPPQPAIVPGQTAAAPAQQIATSDDAVKGKVEPHFIPSSVSAIDKHIKLQRGKPAIDGLQNLASKTDVQDEPATISSRAPRKDDASLLAEKTATSSTATSSKTTTAPAPAAAPAMAPSPAATSSAFVPVFAAPVQPLQTDAVSPLGIISVQGADEGQAIVQRSLDTARGDLWLNELAKDIVAARQAESRLNFSLSPEQLGELDVDITNGDDGLSLKLTAQSNEAAQLLNNSQSKLQDELKSQGVRLAEAEVQTRSDNQSQQQQARKPVLEDRSGLPTGINNEEQPEAAAPQGRFA